MLPSHSEIKRITINDILDTRTAVLNSALRPDAVKTLRGALSDHFVALY
jgi:hypothetical protein